MKQLSRLLLGAWERFTDLFGKPYQTALVEEYLPPVLRKRVLYIVEEDGFEEQAALICPCGCDQILHLNLLTDERPCWYITHHRNGTATVYPSVWRLTGCRSHFWIRRGKINWCRGSVGLWRQ